MTQNVGHHVAPKSEEQAFHFVGFQASFQLWHRQIWPQMVPYHLMGSRADLWEENIEFCDRLIGPQFSRVIRRFIDNHSDDGLLTGTLSRGCAGPWQRYWNLQNLEGSRSQGRLHLHVTQWHQQSATSRALLTGWSANNYTYTNFCNATEHHQSEAYKRT